VIDAGVRVGEIFLDKFRVDAILGHGGMGVVALCTHLALGELVAIKMLRRDVIDDDEAVERFMREAQAASRLKSEHVARVSDVGRSAANVPYMVMEYLEGHDLEQLLGERCHLGQAWAVELALQACEALAEAHSIGIVHRDVKPSNLFVTWRPDGSALIKVLDFGISKAITGEAMRLTQTQSLLGTPAYMSPEQMRCAREVDARADIWSLGTVLYEMLEGRRPFEAQSFSAMCIKVAVEPPAPMTNIPAGLQQVVLRCLAKPPEERYASMAELGRDLAPFSRDPHQAQILVERMTRTLRRSAILDGDLARGVSGSHSDQRRAEPTTSSPALVLPTPQAMVADAAASRAARSEPTPASKDPRTDTAPWMTRTYLVSPRKRWRALAIVAALVAAVAGGAAISIVRGPAAPAPSSPQAEPTRGQPPSTSSGAQRGEPADRAAAPAPAAPASPASPVSDDATPQRDRDPGPATRDTPPTPAGPRKPVQRSTGRTPASSAGGSASGTCDPLAGAHASNTCLPEHRNKPRNEP
jgi:serine/threonine-protein kinase